MRKKNSPVRRIDPRFDNDMRCVAKHRFTKGLASMSPSALSMREMTNLLTKTEGYPGCLDELYRKPKKK